MFIRQIGITRMLSTLDLIDLLFSKRTAIMSNKFCNKIYIRGDWRQLLSLVYLFCLQSNIERD